MSRPESTYRFDFHEIVRVVSDDPERAPINGERGVVLGRTDDPAAGGYGVFIYRDERVWDVSERDLESTGEREPPPKPTHAVRVAVDEQGRGEIVGVRKLSSRPLRDALAAVFSYLARRVRGRSRPGP